MLVIKKFDQKNDLVSGSDCLYMKDALIKHVTGFDMNSMSYHNKVLLEVQERLGSSDKDVRELKFKKLSVKANAPRRATEGSLGYDLYSAEKVVIFPQTCKAVATEITFLPPPGVYFRAALRSSMALKNTDVRAGVIDLDYRGNVKVVRMSHSTDFNFNIEVGDKISQFILTRFESTDVAEVSELDSTDRGSGGFGSNGQ